MDRRRTTDTRLARSLDQAIARGEMEVLFQPKFRAADDGLIGAEALARWNSPDHGPLAGDALFRLAARAGLAHRLALHLWSRALAEAACWPEHLRLSLNITATDLAGREFPQPMSEAMRLAGFAPNRLTLEITEQAMLLDLDRSAAKLQHLADMGVAIALDDFGAGFCNFRYLKRLPLDALKLDRSMIEGITDCAQDLAVLRGIVAMARALGLQVIAEGVENGAQRDAIAAEGCAVWQGFLGGRPMSPEDFAALAKG